MERPGCFEFITVEHWPTPTATGAPAAIRAAGLLGLPLAD